MNILFRLSKARILADRCSFTVFSKMLLNVEVSKLPFPKKITFHHFAVTWKTTTIVWGIEPLSAIYYHNAGKWMWKNAVGNAPERHLPSSVTVHTIGSRMLVFGGHRSDFEPGPRDGSVVYSLDLDAFRWSRFDPTGNGPSDLQWGMRTWVHGKKVYCFGGARLLGGDGNWKLGNTNDMFCYDPCENSWERVVQGGEIPSPRECCKGPST